MDIRQQYNNKLHGEQGIIASIIGPDGRLRGIRRPAEWSCLYVFDGGIHEKSIRYITGIGVIKEGKNQHELLGSYKVFTLMTLQ